MSQPTAVITGAAGGIGQALVRTFGAAGYRTVALDMVDCAHLADAFVAVDLNDYCREDDIRRRVNGALRDAIGPAPLGALVNNAATQIVRSTADLTLQDWTDTLSVNLVAPFLLSQALLDDLTTAHGSIVNIASIHSRLTKPGFVCYATSKAALIGLTRSMAVDIGSRVRVNAICPAAIETPMLEAGFRAQPEARSKLAAYHPVGRLGDPNEVARAALFLASGHAQFLNGSILSIDGGIASCLHDPS